MVYGLGLVKNEADVLEQSIRHAATICDRIFYMDNGSTDDSWAIIEALAQEMPGRVIAYERTFEPYVEGMRNRIQNELAAELGSDGWWLKLDADEFLCGDPRPTIAAAMKEGRNGIRCWQVQFAFTDVDVARWELGLDDRSLPIDQRRRYYDIDWREYRLWRNDPSRRWEDVTRSHPEWVTAPTRRSLYNRHFQYRDPIQIQARLDVRFGDLHFPHERSPDWRSVVRPAAELSLYVEGVKWRHNPLRYYSQRVRTRGNHMLGRAS